MKKIKIFLADDHRLVIDMWSSLLGMNENFEIAGTAYSGNELLEKIQNIRPDVLLLDISLPDASGIDITKDIRKMSPGTKIIAVSMHTQPAYVKNIMNNGAKGYISKTSSSDEMIEAINYVMEGKVYICNDIKKILEEKKDAKKHKLTLPNFNSLTRREIEIVNLIRSGLSTTEVADKLNIAIKTVEVHRYNIFKKLNVKNSLSLVHMANNELL